MKNFFKNWKERACLFLIIANIQFIILGIIAMFFYTGGTYHNPSNPGYDFWNNFLSDLGRTKSFSGRSNAVSFVITTITLSIFGFSFIPFFLALTSHFSKESKSQKWVSVSTAFFGIIAAICNIGVAFTPWDLYLLEHNLFVFGAFTSTFLACILCSIVIFLNKNYPNKYAIVFIAFSIAMNLYILLTIFGPWDKEGFTLQITGQKIIVYCMCSTFIIQGYGAWKMFKVIKI